MIILEEVPAEPVKVKPRKGDLVMVRDYDYQEWVPRIHAYLDEKGQNFTVSIGFNWHRQYSEWNQWRFPTDGELKQIFEEEPENIEPEDE